MREKMTRGLVTQDRESFSVRGQPRARPDARVVEVPRTRRERLELVRDSEAYVASADMGAVCPGMAFDFDTTGRLCLQHSCFLCTSQARRLEDELDNRSLRDLVVESD